MYCIRILFLYLHICIYITWENQQTLSCTVEWQSNLVKECIKPYKSWGKSIQTQRV